MASGPGEAIGDVTGADVDALTPPLGREPGASALARSLGQVQERCRDVRETLDALSGALALLRPGQSSDAGGGGFGLAGLPMAAALRGIQALTSQYLDRQTGMRLPAWLDAVDVCADRFSAYMGHLERAGKTLAPPKAERPGRPASGVRREALTALWEETLAWKVVLTRVAQLGLLVDAVVRAAREAPASAAEDQGEPTRHTRVPGALQRGLSRTLDRAGELGERVAHPAGDLGEWVTRPFVEVRERVERLPGQIEELSAAVELLEVLLDLDLSRLASERGELTPHDAVVVATRVAAVAWLPELARDLAMVREEEVVHAAWLDRVASARASGEVSQRAAMTLEARYQAALEAVRARRSGLDVWAQAWLEYGPAVLDACATWVRAEVELVEARQLVEQADVDRDRRARLLCEEQRLDESRTLLTSLAASLTGSAETGQPS